MIAIDVFVDDFQKHVMKVSPWACLPPTLHSNLFRKTHRSNSYQKLQQRKTSVEYLSISGRQTAFLAFVQRGGVTPVKSLVVCDLSLGIFSHSLTDRDWDSLHGINIISPKVASSNQPTSMFLEDLVCAFPSMHQEYILKPYFWENLHGKGALVVTCRVSNPWWYLKHKQRETFRHWNSKRKQTKTNPPE